MKGAIDWISWAPGTAILFNDSGTHSIRADGGGLQRMIARGWTASWSPGGRAIAATYGDSGVGVAELRGGGFRRLTRTGNNPFWSPAGDRIGYAGLGQIRIVRRDGSGDHVAVALRYGQNFHRENDFSPDGRQVVFSACLRPVAEGQVCPDAIFRAELARPRGRRRVSPSQGTCPAWGRLGLIAYNSDRGVAVVRAAGGKPRILVRRAASCASWSPSGKLLAVEGNRNLIVTRVAGRAQRRLGSFPPLPTCCSYPRAPAPAWSPDGRYIAVARAVEGRETKIAYRIYVVRVGDGRARLIVRTPFS